MPPPPRRARKPEADRAALRWRRLASAPSLPPIMAMEFGWWVRDPEEGKYEVHAVFHGGNITWKRHQGHHTPWEPITNVTTEMWDKLMDEAAKRVPRRLMSPKQYDELKRLRVAAEDGTTPKPLKRGAHLKRARDLPSPDAPA
jgi:hypothetical protein